MKNDYNKEKLLKALETKLNEQKMLTETLYEAFDKGSSEKTLERIEGAIKDTVRNIMEIKKEIDSLNVEYKRYSDKPKSNIFDEIKKADKEKTQYNNVGELLDVDNILFCNRFLLDLKTIGIPEAMVKWVHSDVFNGDNIIEAQIYDFISESGEPVLSVLSRHIGTKFTAEIKHLDPTGVVVYKEKYNGCKIEKIYRDSLRYSESEPSGILLRIHYDGVSYEASR